MIKKLWLIIGIISLFFSASLVWADRDNRLDRKAKEFRHEEPKGFGPRDLNEQQIVDGLKEALHVSAENAANYTGRRDGFFGNPVIKIPIPDQLRKAEKILRKTGSDKTVDDFVLSMNRAAEQAAPSAKRIFWHAIKEMSFEDARQILRGDDTAATEYFRRKTSEELRNAFRPVVVQATNNVGVTSNYKTLVGKAKSIPFVKVEPVDIDEYVVTKAL
ncbi:MAG TPA: DUF4197 domain-containing protein, partial [Firmicutes bacterium]|nr:DUF4197 domain-containing protein [Bacillota bacterium]